MIRDLGILWILTVSIIVQEPRSVLCANECDQPLGMESGLVKEWQLYTNSDRVYYRVKHARLNKQGCWCSNGNGRSGVFLQIDFLSEKFISGIATQSDNRGTALEYTLSFSRFGLEWFKYKEAGVAKIFSREGVKYSTVVYHNLTTHVRARKMRIYIERFDKAACLAVEVYGCSACSDPFGLESGAAPDSSIAATSFSGKGYEPRHARLNRVSGSGSWCSGSNAAGQYLQVDLGKEQVVSAIATQGNAFNTVASYIRKIVVNCSEYSNDTSLKHLSGDNCTIDRIMQPGAWVKQFQISYSSDGIIWSDYSAGGAVKEFIGNIKYDKVKMNYFNNELRARYIRIKPTKWMLKICLRVELYKCEACTGELGIAYWKIENEAMTASSHLGPGYEPWMARLGNPLGAWCASVNNLNQYLRVDLGQTYRLGHMAVEGANGTEQWVKSFTLSFSADTEGEQETPYTEDGSVKTFLIPSVTGKKLALRSGIFGRHIRVVPRSWNNAICMRIEFYGCPICGDPLGMENGAIRDWDIKFTSEAAKDFARFITAQYGWEINSGAKPAFVQVHLGPARKIITAVATQLGRKNQYLISYSISYSEDGIEWVMYRENGDVKVIDAKPDWYKIEKYYFRYNITARFLRLHPQKIHLYTSLKFELYGCHACAEAQGLGDGRLQNALIDASSYNGPGYEPWRARLHSSAAWCASHADSNKAEYLEITLENATLVSRIATQGSTTSNAWVTKYNATYSMEGLEWYSYDVNRKTKIFRGNWDATGVAQEELESRLVAKKLRLWPVTWSEKACLRVEIYGCAAVTCSGGVGLKTGIVADSRVTASSWLGTQYRPYYGRLGQNIGFGSWCGASNDAHQFLQVDLGVLYKITAVATQGKHSLPRDNITSAWVTQYTLSNSDNGRDWNDVKEGSIVKTFSGGVKSVIHKLTSPVVGQLFRFYPKSWSNHICLRVELYGCKACMAPLGLENGKIKATAIITRFYSTKNYARVSGTSNGSAWHFGPFPSDGQFIQFDLGTGLTKVTGIGIQGEHVWFVTRYTVSYSEDGDDWRDIIENGKTKLFVGNIDPISIKIQTLMKPIKARFITIRPKELSGGTEKLRVEIYGCEVCREPVGLENGSLHNTFVTATSKLTNDYAPGNARLKSTVGAGSWCPLLNSTGEYIQVEFPQTMLVSQIATQGNPFNDYWVEKYSLAYRQGNETWKDLYDSTYISADEVIQHFRGNIDRNSIVRAYLNQTVTMDAIRIIPWSWTGRACLRLEIYGCIKVCNDLLETTLPKLKKGSMTASSYEGPSHAPWMASMLGSDLTHAWCAADDVSDSYLQVDLGTLSHVREVVTEGLLAENVSESSVVIEYRLQYSGNGKDWTNYTEQGVLKLFQDNTDFHHRKVQLLNETLYGRFIRIYPTKWKNRMCMKVAFSGCKVCGNSLGMENRDIKRSQLEVFDGTAARGRLRRAESYSSGQLPCYYQIDLLSTGMIITAVAMQDGSDPNGFITAYYLLYNTDGSEWVKYNEKGVVKIFEGYREFNTTMKHNLENNLTTRYLRFIPSLSHGHIKMRVELYGCDDCNQNLGSAEFRSTDGLKTHIVQIDLNEISEVAAIGTMASSDNSCKVTRYSLYYSVDGKEWRNYPEEANAIPESLKGNEGTYEFLLRKQHLRSRIRAKHIIINPTAWSVRNCLRIIVYGCKAKPKTYPLGMENGRIKNESLSASSSLNNNFLPSFARLHANILGGSWCSRIQNISQFFQLDLLEVHRVTEVHLQGLYDGPTDNWAWVTKYQLSYNTDNLTWTVHNESGNIVFTGVSQEKPLVHHKLQPAIFGLSLRVHPTEWHNRICLRIELIGCKACARALGMENFDILHHDLGSSTLASQNYWTHARPQVHGRLSFSRHSTKEFFSVNLRPFGRTVTAISVFGKHLGSFTLSLSDDAIEWYDYIVDGETVVFTRAVPEANEVTKFPLRRNISSEFVRFNPRTWYSRNSLKFELYGCDVCDEPLGLVSGLIPNTSITASSSLAGHEPWHARFGSGSTAWCAVTTDLWKEWLAVDLGETKLVTSIVMVGDIKTKSWAKKFVLSYKREDSSKWIVWTRRYGEKTYVKSPDIQPHMAKRTRIAGRLEARHIQLTLAETGQNKACAQIEIYGCQLAGSCNSELGLSTWKVKDAAFTASSFMNRHSSPWLARLHSHQGLGAWCATPSDTNPFLEINLFWEHRIRYISTQGMHVRDAWLTQFTLSYVGLNTTWINYTEAGAIKVFGGNKDRQSAVQHKLQNSIEARYIRIHPKTWIKFACVRLELYGCRVYPAVYSQPLGMVSKVIPDANIFAPSWAYGDYFPWHARLGKSKACWRPVLQGNDLQFLIVDLGQFGRTVTAVATQGHFSAPHTVTAYNLEFSEDGCDWYSYVENSQVKVFGADDGGHPNMVVKSNLRRPVPTRYIKFKVKAYRSYVSLRVEIYGYKEFGPMFTNSSVTSNNSFSASSYKPNFLPEYGRLDYEGSWCSDFDDPWQYLQIHFQTPKSLTGVATQGNARNQSWVTRFKLAYSLEGQGWRTYQEYNKDKILASNSYIVKHVFKRRLLAGVVRFIPVEWTKHICMNVELYGSEASEALGMEKWKIPSSAITASSSLSPDTLAWMGRLNSDWKTAWCAGENDDKQYLEIDLGDVHHVTDVSTQGRYDSGSDAWVTEYQLTYSEDNATWKNYSELGISKIFKGNNDSISVMKNNLKTSVLARYVRFLPVSWWNSICMKVEIFGFKTCCGSLGVGNLEIPNSAITASSALSGLYSFYGRLNSLQASSSCPAWMADPCTANCTAEWLRVDLGTKRVVSGMATQGRICDGVYYVTNYTLSYSSDGVVWSNYTVDGTIKMFEGSLHRYHTRRHKLPSNITTRYVQFNIKGWIGPLIALRVELYGCQVAVRDGGYTEFTEWSNCSVTCGVGMQTRSRNCSNPTPRNGGRNCTLLGRSMESRYCNTHLCPALNVTSDEFATTFQSFEVALDDCRRQNVTVDFGDCTGNTTTTKCNFSHVYLIPGIYEVHIYARGHVVTRQMVYVQEQVASIEILTSHSAFKIGNGFSGQWRITNGTMVYLTISYGDATMLTFLLGNVLGTLVDTLTRIYQNVGIYEIGLTAFNNISEVSTSKTVIIEVPVEIGNITVKNLAPFENIYQFDYFEATIEAISGTNLHYSFKFDVDQPFINQTLPEIVYRYTVPAMHNLTVVVFNNASSLNATLLIPIQKVIPLQDLSIGIPYTNITNITAITINITEGEPYICTCNFGDGQQASYTSEDDSIFNHTYSDIREFPVHVNCSNHFSNKKTHGVAVVQQPIRGVVFSNNAPREQNETMQYLITAEKMGTNSCFVLNLGDGTVIGYGLPECHNEYPGVSFLEMSNISYQIRHIYTAIGEYVLRLELSNKVSRVTILDRAVVVKIPCNYPNVTIYESVGKQFNERTKIQRVQEMTIDTRIQIDCKATQLTDLSWVAYRLSSDGVIIDNGSIFDTQLDTLLLRKRSLDYGFYLLRFNVSMYGQEGVYRCDEAYLEVVASPLVPLIDGGTAVQRKFATITVVSAALSWDPDFVDGNNFGYYWLCQNSKLEISKNLLNLTNGTALDKVSSFNSLNFCDASKPGTLVKSGPTVQVNTGILNLNDTYDIFLLLTKNTDGYVRMNNVTQKIKIIEGDPPEISVRCYSNCGLKVLPSEKYSLKGSCQEETPSNKAVYKWKLLKEVVTGNQRKWKAVDNLWQYAATNTNLSSNSIVLHPNAMQGGLSYKLILTGNMHGRVPGLAEVVFTVNKPPHNGECGVNPSDGTADESVFTFSCSHWTDTDVPLTYEYYYKNTFGLEVLIYRGPKQTVETKLPIGDIRKNYTLNFFIRIVDTYGAFNSTTVKVQVRIPEQNKTVVMGNLSNLVTGNNSLLSLLLRNGKYQEAVQESISLLSVVNAYSHEDGAGSVENIKMRTEVVKLYKDFNVTSVSGIQMVGSCLAEATAVMEEVNLETQNTVLGSVLRMQQVLANSSRDPTIPSSKINGGSEVVVNCLMNVISASGDSARVFDAPSAKDQVSEASVNDAKNNVKRASALVQNVMEILLDLRLPSEGPQRIMSPSGSMVVNRQLPDAEGNQPISDGNAEVTLPPLGNLLGNSISPNSTHVDIKYVRFTSNLYSWDQSGSQIKSHVMDLQLKDDAKSPLNVTGASEDIDLYIPLDSSKIPKPHVYFLAKQNGSMRYHRFVINTTDPPMSLRVAPVDRDDKFEIYWKYRVRPEANKDDVITTLPDYSSCTVINGKHTDCQRDPYMVLVDTSRTPVSGAYFLGIRNIASESANRVRRKRSCSGGDRFKRSCLQYKDPPPTLAPTGGTYQTVVPMFRSDMDFNYTMDTIKSPCLYWDAKREAWTSDGCKVGNKTRLDRLHCQCNHLTAFGGDMLVAPNPIDFDKVFQGFANIGENLSVLVTIISVFLVYALFVVWARKKDRRDAIKGGVTIIHSDSPLGQYSYEITVQTGSWQGSGTTANVYINLMGQEGETGPIRLTDESKVIFTRGATNEFHISLEKNLGQLSHLRAWHDMTGSDSSWYLSYVIVRDLDSNDQWIFACDQWFALEREDGAVDRIIAVSDKSELTSFRTLFRTKTSKDLFDGHLWISVIAKPPRSTFTRVQRASCCLSLLFTAMITNAMFYNVGGKSDTSTFTLGPFTFSLRQIMIGVQSSFIALPVNIAILQIFRNARPKEHNVAPKLDRNASKYKSSEHTLEKRDESSSYTAPVKPKGLPHWCVYIAWILCYSTSLVAATFTLFYSMMWGKETSNQWLSSMMISFFQDAFVTQPMKIFLLALIFAALIKKLPSDFSKGNEEQTIREETKETSEEIQKEKEPCKFFQEYAPPNEEMVAKARARKLKELSMYSIIRENMFHLFFVLVLVGISYGARDTRAYVQSKVVEDAFSTQVTKVQDIWSFVSKYLFPFVYTRQWYNGRLDTAEGFISDKQLYIVGMPRLRQQRVEKTTCQTPLNTAIDSICGAHYSPLTAESSYFLPGWRKESNLTFKACPIPWRYQTSNDLNGIPFWGKKSVYTGGGYTADLGYTLSQAKRITSDLKAHDWIDRFSRAVFVEFTLFNAHVNLFTIVTYLVETSPTGGASTFMRVETFRLYQHVGPSAGFLIFCESVAIFIILTMFYKAIKRVRREKRAFFKKSWNVVELVIVMLSFAAFVLYLIRYINSVQTISKLQDNPFLYVNFQVTAYWGELNTYVIAFVVFLATLKFLHLTNFNRFIALLSRTVARLSKRLLALGGEALVPFLAFSLFGYVVFGSKVEGFASVVMTFQTMFALVLGKSYFVELSHTDRLIGPLYFSAYIITMMFFMLNMFCAIINDTYAEINEETNSSEIEMIAFIGDRLRAILGMTSPRMITFEDYKHPEEEEDVDSKMICLTLKGREEEIENVFTNLEELEDNIALNELDIATKLIRNCENNRTILNKQIMIYLAE